MPGKILWLNQSSVVIKTWNFWSENANSIFDHRLLELRHSLFHFSGIFLLLEKLHQKLDSKLERTEKFCSCEEDFYD